MTDGDHTNERHLPLWAAIAVTFSAALFVGVFLGVAIEQARNTRHPAGELRGVFETEESFREGTNNAFWDIEQEIKAIKETQGVHKVKLGELEAQMNGNLF